MPTGSIKSSGSVRSSVRSKYKVVETVRNEQEAEESRSSVRSSVMSRHKVAETVRNVQEAEESSWSDTEDEVEKSSQVGKEGINVISNQSSKIAKVKDTVTLPPGQGEWVHLIEEPWQNLKNVFFFPVLFNTIVEKCLFASKLSPWAGVSRSPAIFMINHTNDVFVQLKRGESLGRLISLVVQERASLEGTRQDRTQR